MRVCQPGPVAFQRANVSRGNRSEMATRALPVLGRPRGRSISLAVERLYSSGNTSRAGRARLKVSLVHTGLSRPARSGLRFFRFISLHLSLVRLPQADHVNIACAWSKHQHMQPLFNKAESLEPTFFVVFAGVFHNERTGPLELGHPFERDAPQGNIFLVLVRVIGDGHLISVYTINRPVNLEGVILLTSPR